jgi:hypothetical protein
MSRLPISLHNSSSCARISVAPPFSRLRRFPQGRGFEQWTGDDSKALMKVSTFLYLLADEYSFMVCRFICQPLRAMCPLTLCVVSELFSSSVTSRAPTSLPNRLWRLWRLRWYVFIGTALYFRPWVFVLTYPYRDNTP